MRKLRARVGLVRDTDAGISLIEAITALMIFSVIALGMTAALGTMTKLTRDDRGVEVALGLAAIATTGALAGYAPSIAEGTGPYCTHATIGPARMEMTVDPARVGPNEIHVYLFDRKSGRQYDATKELTVAAELPERRIARIELSPTKAGPGHYVIAGAALGAPGDWTVDVTARVSDFDEYRAQVEVPIK